MRLKLAASEDKNEAYEVLLRMSELDLENDREEIEELFRSLSITSADSDLYKSLYDSWRLLLAQSGTPGTGN